MAASALLGMGSAMVAALGSAELAALPLLPDWHTTLEGTGNLLAIQEPAGMFYDGDLGRPPAGWRQALQRSGRLVVLVGSTLTLDRGNQYGQLTAASRADEIVGAQLPLT